MTDSTTTPEDKPEETLDTGQARRILGAALGEDPQMEPDKGHVGPSVEEVAAMFPQLEIIELIGRGGMGSVYKARQRSLDRLVALKILHERFSVEPQFMERFTREARTLARLNHPNIVSLHDFGELNGRLFLVMEYVDGPNLRQVIQTRALEPVDALAIVPRLCDALQYAHEEGVIHRDIKPENVLMDKRGRVKIADFGLAKMLGENTPGYTLTGTGTVMGTPHYMAPEQLESPEAVDHRADVFALGVVFYEMLTGELPLGRFQPPSRKVAIDVRLDEVVLRAMDREPSLRYQHASEVRTDVEAITSSVREKATATSGAQPAPSSERNPPANHANIPQPRLEPLSLAAFGFLLAIPMVSLLVTRTLGASSPGQGEPIWRMAIGIPALTFPFIAMLLGVLAAGRIRDARGRKSGLGLAIFCILLIPSGLVLFVASRIWRFAYAVGVSMDNSNFWAAIGRPSYSVADANAEVYWSLAALTAVVIGWFLARSMARHYRPTIDPNAFSNDPGTSADGKGPVPIWYVALILIALAPLVIFALVFAGKSMNPPSNANPPTLTGAIPSSVEPSHFASTHPLAWRILQNGKLLPVASSVRRSWENNEGEGNVPGAEAEDTFQTSTSLIRVKFIYRGHDRKRAQDVYRISTFVSDVNGSGGTISSDVSYNGTLFKLESQSGVEIHLAPSHVLNKRAELERTTEMN